MFKCAIVLFCCLLPLASVDAGTLAGAAHQNSTHPPRLTPLLEGVDSRVLQRMARFLDDYKNGFENHLDCQAGKLESTYGYSRCEERFANGIYITSRQLEAAVKQPVTYTAVFYRYFVLATASGVVVAQSTAALNKNQPSGVMESPAFLDRKNPARLAGATPPGISDPVS